MSHLPFQTNIETGEIWVFSALNCKETIDEINEAADEQQISATYKAKLEANMYEGAGPMKPEKWEPDA